jgi:hypothetical protein
VVWAIDEPHLPNYLLPRNCPRVTFGIGPETSAADRERFGVGGATRVVVIEAAWLHRVMACTLFLYEMPEEGFELLDASAGYFVRYEPAAPKAIRRVDNLPQEITDRGAELRVVRRLWELHDAVARSSLEFSMIRMLNAQR